MRAMKDAVGLGCGPIANVRRASPTAGECGGKDQVSRTLRTPLSVLGAIGPLCGAHRAQNT
jgi:hypothetical protein